jgi:hypothetical protein
MDVLSHGLWGGIAFGRKSKKGYWAAFAFGIMPDILAFGPYFVALAWNALMSAHAGPLKFQHDYASIPRYVFEIYNVTHSLLVFAVTFLLVWAIRRRPCLAMGAWGLHILMDIPTHGARFFPTPFLWPISAYRFDGIPWSHAAILLPDYLLLISLYAWYFWIYRKKKPEADGRQPSRRPEGPPDG